MASYNASGPMAVNAYETRSYGYDVRGRLLSEPFVLNSANPPSDLPNGQQTASYAFDQANALVGSPSVEGGLGARTAQAVNPNTAEFAVSQNNFQQVTQDDALLGDGNLRALDAGVRRGRPADQSA